MSFINSERRGGGDGGSGSDSVSGSGGGGGFKKNSDHFGSPPEVFRDANVEDLTPNANVTRVEDEYMAKHKSSLASLGDCLHLFSTEEVVRAFNNNKKLLELNRPIKLIKALNTGPKAHEATTDQAGNLEQQLALCIGARVMLTKDEWVEGGLVNGALGTITQIEWDEDADTEIDMPFVVMVKFDDYEGPAFQDDSNALPIMPETRHFKYQNNDCTRTQFPLRISYAIEVHE